jgi:hypothetical protein
VWGGGRKELRNTSDRHLQDLPHEPVPVQQMVGTRIGERELSNHRITQTVAWEPGLPGTYHVRA